MTTPKEETGTSKKPRAGTKKAAKKRRSRGEGSIHPTGDGGWRATADLGIDPATGKRLRKHFYGRTKKEVTDKLVNHRAGVGKETQETPQEVPTVPLAKRRATLHDYLDRWVERRRVSDETKTYEYYAQHVRTYVKPFFSPELLLEEVTSQEVRDFYGRLLASGTSPNQASKVGTTLNVLLNDAVRDLEIPYNAAAKVKKPKKTHHEAAALSEDEIKAFFLAASKLPKKWFAFFVTMIDTGMRPGELWALRWQDVDLAAGSISIRRAATQTLGGMVVKPPKTKKSARHLLLAASTLKELRDLRESLGEEPTPDTLVFPNKRGGIMRFSNFYDHVYNPTLLAASVRHVPLYSLRHTSATIMLLLGVSPKVVAERLGHSTTTLTMNTYSHVLPTMQKDAAKKMEEFLLGSGLGSSRLGPNADEEGKQDVSQGTGGA